MEVEAFDLLHYIPPDGRLYHSLDELGGGSREPGGESYFHTLVMRGGSLEGSGRERVLEGFCWDR